MRLAFRYPVTPLPDLAGAVLRGDVRASAKAMSLVEAGGERASTLLRQLYPSSGRARRIGLTGPPGAGKSTLAGRLASRFRANGEAVGVLAIDASSPFTGGALLGDRIRMQHLAHDRGVFIRSMGSGESQGGLAASSLDVVRVMEAMGKDVVLLETVGVGQTAIDIIYQVETTVAVLVPESGDEVQSMKAGLLEAADIVVVNKADRPGADGLTMDLIDSACCRGSWCVPVLKVSAESSEGVDALLEQMEKHAQHLDATGEGEARRTEQLRRELLGRGVADGTVESILSKILAGEGTPYDVFG